MKERIQLALARKVRHWLAILDRKYEHDARARIKSSPRNFIIDTPYRLIHPEFMEIGDDVYLGPNSMLDCMIEYPGPELNAPAEIVAERFNPRIVIGDRVSATGGLQLAACMEIVIEDDVLFATNINLTDAFHGYTHVDLPYKFQNMWQAAPIRIKRGSWIGQNVVITPGVTVGEMSIIGANSVVNRNIPDRSIAVGAPAKVVKSWCGERAAWVEVND